MQDALTESQTKKTLKRETDGQQYYDYELFGPVRGCVQHALMLLDANDTVAISLPALTCAKYSLQSLSYLASVTIRQGKVFAMFIKSPSKVCPCCNLLGTCPDRHRRWCNS